MHFVLAAFYPPYSPFHNEVCSVVEISHHELHEVRDNEHPECPELQHMCSMTRWSRVYRETITNVFEVEIVTQNRKLVLP
jgi:hypothetical protein